MEEKHVTAVQLNEEEILASLRRQVQAETPDILDRLMEKISLAEGEGQNDAYRQVDEAVSSSPGLDGLAGEEAYEIDDRKEASVLKGPNVRKRRRRYITALVGIAAMLAVCFGVFFQAGRAVSIIQIDVNPSVELSVDQKDRVTEARALNSDGQKVLEGMNLKRVDADVAVNAIIGSMVKQGYFSTSQSAVLVTVINKDPKKSQELGQRIASDINQTFTSQNRQVRIYNQGLVSGENVKKQAKQYGISLGKMAFIDKLIQQDPSLSREQLAQMTIAQLEQVIVNHNLDLSGMEEYDQDDSISENIEEIIEEIDENPSQIDENSSQIDDNPSKQVQSVHRKSDSDEDQDDDEGSSKQQIKPVDHDSDDDEDSSKQQIKPANHNSDGDDDEDD